jgi:hypothetical protein
MNLLTATAPNGQQASVLIHTGAHKSARRVPAAFARGALVAGATLTLETARGLQPRVIVERHGRFYTRVGGAA